MKRKCTRCGRTKPVTQFHNHAAGRDGIRAQCKDCIRDQWLQRAYGITRRQYQKLLGLQRWRCAICRTRRVGERRLHVDHDHATGVVRGLLCYSCNSKLGWFEKNRDAVLAYVPEEGT